MTRTIPCILCQIDPLATQSTNLPTKIWSQKLWSQNLWQLSHLQQKAVRKQTKINFLVLVENFHGHFSSCPCSYIINKSMKRVINCSFGEGEIVLVQELSRNSNMESKGKECYSVFSQSQACPGYHTVGHHI